MNLIVSAEVILADIARNGGEHDVDAFDPLAHLDEPQERPSCGTPKGRGWHQRRGERSCDRCKAARTDSRHHRQDEQVAA